MVISLAPEIMHLKEPLEEKGFCTVAFSKNSTPVDALLYYDENFISRNELLMNTQTVHGVLLVNVRNKSIDEIEYILQHKTYSPLI